MSAADSLLEEHRRKTVRAMAERIAARLNVPVEEMLGRSRDADLVAARRVLYAELRERDWSYPMIARAVDRDHTTILHALAGLA